MRENYLYEKISNIFEKIDFTEKKIELMYLAAKEKIGFDNKYDNQVLTTLQRQLEGLRKKESLLLDTFLAQQISKELYDVKVLNLQNERISISNQINERKLNEPFSVLEQTKKVFLDASRAKKEFLAGDDFKKRNILENLCWNLSMKEKNIHKVSLKTRYDIMFKAPKKGDILTLLADSSWNPVVPCPARRFNLF